MQSLVSISAVILLSCASPFAQATCTQSEQKVIGHNKEKIGIYSVTGNFLREVPKEMLPLGSKVLDCNESLGLGLVQLLMNAAPPASQKPVQEKGPRSSATVDTPAATPPGEWIDLLDVKVSQQFQAPCVSTPSAANDRKNSQSAGVSKGDCKPVKPPTGKLRN